MVASVQGNGPQGTVIQFTVPKQGGLYADATYYCWLPSNVVTVRTVIVHQHGCTREGDAQQMMNDLQWLTLAKKWNAVFIAPKLITGAPGSGSTQCNNWYVPASGSANTFLAALDTLARRSGHPEIKVVPWALWGHSGGALWITAMTGAYPGRVAVAVAQSGANDISATPAVLKVPILHHNGKKDMIYNGARFTAGRTKGALWSLAVNPDPMWENPPPNPGWGADVLGHAPHDMRMIAIPWIEAGLQSRLSATAGSAQIADMDITHGWLGDTTTFAIASEAAFTGNRQIAAWFPNQAYAVLWKEYMQTGTQNDITPPAAPTNLNGAYTNRQIRLTWDSDADLESGIKTFIIYRNGALLTTMQFNGTSLFTKEKGFQRWNDGDQPAQSAPAMIYTDSNLDDTATYMYQVSTVNWSNVAGPKSNTITLRRGQVTDIGSVRAAGKAAHKSLVFCWIPGACNVEMPSGGADIYDMRGNLIKSVDARSGRVDFRALLANHPARIYMIRSRP